MTAATEYEGRPPETKTGVDRHFIGFGPPNGFQTRNGDDASGEKVALIAVRDARRRAEVTRDYLDRGYMCVACAPNYFDLTLASHRPDSETYTVVTDDLDLMYELRLSQDRRANGMAIHAVIDEGEILNEAHAESLFADRLVPHCRPPKIFESISEPEGN